MKTALFLSTLLLLIVCYYPLKSARDLHVFPKYVLNATSRRARKSYISSGWVAADRKAPHHDVGQIPAPARSSLHPSVPFVGPQQMTLQSFQGRADVISSRSYDSNGSVGVVGTCRGSQRGFGICVLGQRRPQLHPGD